MLVVGRTAIFYFVRFASFDCHCNCLRNNLSKGEHSVPKSADRDALFDASLTAAEVGFVAYDEATHFLVRQTVGSFKTYFK